MKTQLRSMTKLTKMMLLPLATILTIILIILSWPTNNLTTQAKISANPVTETSTPGVSAAPATTTNEPDNTSEEVKTAPVSAPATIATAAVSNIKIVVNLPACELSFIENGQVKKTFQVTVAQPRYAMPIIAREASHLVWNPSWTPPNSPWAKNAKPSGPGAPGNPLGPMKIRLGGPYLIHGGGDGNVGNALSHGCIRMRNAEVLELAQLIIAARSLPISAEKQEKMLQNRKHEFSWKLDQPIPVEINYQTIMVENNQVIIHPDIYHRGTNKLEQLKDSLSKAGINYEELSIDDQLSLTRGIKESKRQSIELTRAANRDLPLSQELANNLLISPTER